MKALNNPGRSGWGCFISFVARGNSNLPLPVPRFSRRLADYGGGTLPAGLLSSFFSVGQLPNHRDANPNCNVRKRGELAQSVSFWKAANSILKACQRILPRKTAVKMALLPENAASEGMPGFLSSTAFQHALIVAKKSLSTQLLIVQDDRDHGTKMHPFRPPFTFDYHLPPDTIIPVECLFHSRNEPPVNGVF